MSSIYEEVTAQIIEALENGVIPWRKPWTSLCPCQVPTNLASGREYRGINVFLLGLAMLVRGFGTPYFMTLRQANKLGGRVMKGAKGQMVIFSKPLERPQASSDSEDRDHEEDDVKIVRSFIYRRTWAFNLDQIEGVDLPAVEANPNAPDPIEAAEAIVRNMPNAPAIIPGGDRAYYSPHRDVIGMPPLERFHSAEGYYETLFHEMTHSTGHENRLNRQPSTEARRFGDREYSQEELVAEMGAAFLCAKAGVTLQIDNHAAYIDGWLSVFKNDTKVLLKAASAAQKASDYILDVSFNSVPVATERQAA